MSAVTGPRPRVTVVARGSEHYGEHGAVVSLEPDLVGGGYVYGVQLDGRADVLLFRGLELELWRRLPGSSSQAGLASYRGGDRFAEQP